VTVKDFTPTSPDAMPRSPAPLSSKRLLGFGLGSLGTGIFSTTPGVLLLYFLTDTLGVPAALAGLAVFLPKAWDVIADPIMGFISDRTRSRYGRRRPYLLAGAIGMAITYAFLFTVPVFASPITSFWYVMILFALSATAYTVFAIPYVSMPAEMSADSNERTRILAYRMSFAMAGAIIGSAGAPGLVHEFGGGRHGYAAMSIVVGVFCAAAMLSAFLATRHVRLRDSIVVEGGIGQQLAHTLRNRYFRALALVYIVQIVGIGTLIAAAPYYASRILHDGEGLVSKMLLIMMGVATLSISLWNSLALRYGKQLSYYLAIVLLAASSAGMWFLSPSMPIGCLYALLAVTGLGFGAQQVLPFAMLTDVIHADPAGAGREGVTTGFWVAGEKFGLALGPLLAGIILQAGGFHEGLSAAAAQPPSALIAIRAAFSLVPAALLISSVWLLTRYRLPREGLGH
jgi:glycoside/pentoside/hexuronide:cation symporter, GPH family